MSLLLFMILMSMTDKGIKVPDIGLVVVAILYIGDCILLKGSSISKRLKSLEEGLFKKDKEWLKMEFRLTSESMELLVESIVDAVETTEDRDMQFEKVKTIFEGNGIVEIKD